MVSNNFSSKDTKVILLLLIQDNDVFPKVLNVSMVLADKTKLKQRIETYY